MEIVRNNDNSVRYVKDVIDLAFDGIRPVLKIANASGSKRSAILDTGSTIPIWFGDNDKGIKDFGGVPHGDKHGVIEGIGNDVAGKIYLVTFGIGAWTFCNIPFVLAPRNGRRLQFRALLPATLFESFDYSVLNSIGSLCLLRYDENKLVHFGEDSIIYKLSDGECFIANEKI